MPTPRFRTISKLVLLGLAPLAFALLPSALLENGPELCLIKGLFHIECWGCGITRAVHRLLRGDWEAAIAYNRLVTVVAPLLTVEWVRLLRRHFPKTRSQKEKPEDG